MCGRKIVLFEIILKTKLQGRPQDLGEGGGARIFFSDLGICEAMRIARRFGGMLHR